MLAARWGQSKQPKVGITIGFDRCFNLLHQALQSRQKLGVAARLLLTRVNLLSQVADLLRCYRNFTQSRGELGRQAKLPRELLLRRFHARIQFDRQRLCAAFAVRRELHGVVAWHCQGSGRSPERAAHALRRCVTKIPDESVRRLDSSYARRHHSRIASPVFLQRRRFPVGWAMMPSPSGNNPTSRPPLGSLPKPHPSAPEFLDLTPAAFEWRFVDERARRHLQ